MTICTPPIPHTPPPEVLFRYQIVSEVRAQCLRGHPLAAAVQTASARTHVTASNQPRTVSRRTVYRWLGLFDLGGLDTLAPAARKRTQTSVVLPRELIDFIANEKRDDPAASIPEVLRRAVVAGHLTHEHDVDRTTAWRLCKRMGLPTHLRPAKNEGDTRRFAYPHRMMMVLADGKHFRAGATRARRVVLFYLDDATRYALHAVVGSSESTELFLRGLYELLCKHGLMSVLFLDNGPGFISDDTWAVTSQLPVVHLVHGTAAYAAGHGKIERFNRTAQADVLRSLDGAAEVDPRSAAVELRLHHYLDEYNGRPHGALNGRTPCEAWQADPRALSLPADRASLRAHFVVTEDRKVSNDHVIRFGGLEYEAPHGLAKQTVQVRRQVLDGTLSVVHRGKVVVLKRVDKAHNARTRRATKPAESTTEHDLPLTKTAATRAYERDLGSVLAPDGGYADQEQ